MAAACEKVDFTRITSKLGLGKETLSALSAFRKRHDDAKRLHNQYKNAQVKIDFGHYKNVLKNQDIVQKLEQARRDFKPVTYDLNHQLKAIDAFHEKAVVDAKEAQGKIDKELKALDDALADIQNARPIDDLTVDDVFNTDPRLEQVLVKRIKRGEWSVPLYQERFVNLNLF